MPRAAQCRAEEPSASYRVTAVKPPRVGILPVLLGLLIEVGLSCHASADSFGWKDSEITLNGDQTATITTAKIRNADFFHFAPNPAHNRTFDSGWSNNKALPFGQPWSAVSSAFVASPTTVVVPYHGGTGTHDWSLPAPAFDPKTGKTTLQIGVYAGADAPTPVLLHGETFGFLSSGTYAAENGKLVQARDGNVTSTFSKVQLLLVNIIVSNPLWCDLQVSSEASLTDAFDYSSDFSIDGQSFLQTDTHASAEGGGDVVISDGFGILLTASSDSSAYAATDLIDPLDPTQDISLWASLANGLFATSVGMADMPWQLTYDGGEVVDAFLPASNSFLATWNSPVISAGDHSFEDDAQATAEAEKEVPEPSTLLLLSFSLGNVPYSVETSLTAIAQTAPYAATAFGARPVSLAF